MILLLWGYLRKFFSTFWWLVSKQPRAEALLDLPVSVLGQCEGACGAGVLQSGLELGL